MENVWHDNCRKARILSFNTRQLVKPVRRKLACSASGHHYYYDMSSAKTATLEKNY